MQARRHPSQPDRDLPVSPSATPPVQARSDHPPLPHWNLLVTAFSQLSDFVFVFDRERRVLYANDALLKLWGRTLEQALGKTLPELLQSDEIAQLLERQIQHVLETGENLTNETFYQSPSGVSGFYEYTFNAVQGPSGLIEAVAGATRNISERKHLEKQASFAAALGERIALLPRAAEIMETVVRDVGLQLAVDRCYLCEWEPALDYAEVTHEWSSGGKPSIAGSHRLSSFGSGEWWDLLTAGNVAIDDFHQHELAHDFLPSYEALGIRSYATARFKREGAGIATLVVTMEQPRQWQKHEISLLENVVARAWPLIERAREEQNTKFLGELDRRLAEVGETEDITRLTISSLGEYLGVQRCYFFESVERASDQIRVTENWHRPSVTSLAGTYALKDFGTDGWWQAVKARHFAVDDLNQAAHLEAAPHARFGIRSFATVPFIRAGAWVAGLAVTSDTPRWWKESELQLMENVIARVWPAIERGRINADLRQSAERLNLALSAADLGDFHWDSMTDLMHLSQRAADLYGVTESVGTTRTMLRLRLHPEDREMARRANEEALAAHQDYNLEYRVFRTDGSFRWIAARGRGVYDGNGKPLGMRGVVQDITQRKESEQKLREQEALLRTHAAELERRVQERTASLQEVVTQMEEFSYSVSHDLRGPLRTMQGYAQVLSEDYVSQLDETAQGYLARIQRSCTRMEKLTHDVLLYSRVGKAAAVQQKIDLSKLVHDVVNQYLQLQPPLSQVELIEPLLPVMGHEATLGQAVSNLMMNGVKFVPPGVKPELRVWTEQKGNSVRLWIEDNGIGIEPDQHRNLFKIFERIPTAASYEGTGIGLAIVRKAIEKMGGRYGVESDGKSGSRFWLELPAA